MLVVPLAIALIGLVQLIPLPPGLLAAVSPRGAELRDFALVPLKLESWRPVAVDVPSTARGVARMLSFAMLLFVATELGRLPGLRRRLYSILALSGAAGCALKRSVRNPKAYGSELELTDRN